VPCAVSMRCQCGVVCRGGGPYLGKISAIRSIEKNEPKYDPNRTQGRKSTPKSPHQAGPQSNRTQANRTQIAHFLPHTKNRASPVKRHAQPTSQLKAATINTSREKRRPHQQGRKECGVLSDVFGKTNTIASSLRPCVMFACEY
jgi:hypothetical protein